MLCRVKMFHMDTKFRELSYGSMKFAGFINRTISFVNEKQLYNQKLWKSFVDVYRTMVMIPYSTKKINYYRSS